MDISGKVSLGYKPETVWSALTHQAVMEACIPGCEQFKPISDTQYQIIISAPLVVMKVKFQICLDIEAATPNAYYRFFAQGDGGLSGNASGRCEMKIIEQGDGAEIGYAAQVEMQGILQKVAEPLLQKSAKQLIKKFFNRFETAIQSHYTQS